ncbi:hypothetical protein ACRALDRAFT_211757 [Sodiomyces alcalophilus JCM 7366]|uniref:uncharacterized protein n=1 Tax=Sodiomyces alcalophilus JCM 7366 TaxID=591952 RepID=UPI0039B4C5D4
MLQGLQKKNIPEKLCSSPFSILKPKELNPYIKTSISVGQDTKDLSSLVGLSMETERRLKAHQITCFTSTFAWYVIVISFSTYLTTMPMPSYPQIGN